MEQKAWVVDDRNLYGSQAGRRIAYQAASGDTADNRPIPEVSQKSPALSFSLSMLVWGGGHMLLRDFGRGSILMAAMALFYAVVSCLVMFQGGVSRWVSASGLPASLLLLWAVAVLFLLLVAWLSSAVQVYHRTVGSRSKPFHGVDCEYWPLLCSFLFPGWGQFLNGQPQKGLFFGLFGLLGFCSVLVLIVARQLRPVIQASPDTAAFEISLVAALCVIPVWLLMWIVSLHDAFRVCGEPVNKRPFLNKLKNLRYQVRMQGVVRAFSPDVRSTVLLGLLLAASVLAGIQYFPWDDCLTALEKIRIEMLDSNLEIIPELVRQVMSFIAR